MLFSPRNRIICPKTLFAIRPKPIKLAFYRSCADIYVITGNYTMTEKNRTVAKKLTLPKNFGKMLAGASVCYLALALHLYRPYIPKFQPVQYLFIANSIAGALGCFVLSRRWVSSFVGSLLAGAIYGFGPFALSFAAYHPFAGLPMAAVPWLFCQAAFFRHNTLHKKNFHEFVGLAVLTLLPFAAIALFFWVCAQPWWIKGPFFPLPKTEQMTLTHMAGFLVPLSAKGSFAFAFYHVPVAAIVMGLCMYAAAERFGVLLLVALGFALAFFDTVTPVSPVVWALVPVMFCAILAGLGMQGLAWSGTADRKWILLDIAFIAGCAILTTMLATGQSAVISVKAAALMYWLSVILLATLFFIAKASVRWHILRWILLSAAMAIDIVFGATLIIDKAL